jgi:hypothetical protein
MCVHLIPARAGNSKEILGREITSKGDLMRRGVAFLVGCIVLTAGAPPVSAGGPGWKIFGPYSAKQPQICFYSSADFTRSNNIIKVWTKCLDKKDLFKAADDDTTGTLSDTVAEKIARSYVPPIASVEHLEGDQFIDAVIDEELATTGGLRPLKTVLLEVDCAKKRTREISSSAPVDGQLRTSDTPKDWQRVSPLSEGSSLSRLLCANSPRVRSQLRYASHAATRAYRHYRSTVPR